MLHALPRQLCPRPSDGTPCPLLSSLLSAPPQLRLGTYKLALLVVVVVLLTLMEDGSLLKDLLYALGLYALLGLVLDVGGSIGMAMVGLECDPHFDHPFLVTRRVNPA